MKFYLGAYYLIKLRDSSVIDSLRKYLHTPSTCINDSLLDSWSLSWVQNKNRDFEEASKNFSINSKEITQIQLWTNEKFNDEKILWLNIFSDLETLAEYKRLFKNLDEVKIKILAIYFSQDEKDELLEEFFSENRKVDAFGLEILLSRQIEETSNGETIGYDLIGVEPSGDFHSFYCHDLAKELEEKFSVEINEFGLIKDDKKRKELIEFMNDEENGCEPVPWYFVKVKMFDKN